MAVRVQREAFDVAEEIRLLTDRRTDVGGIVTFTGLVRGEAGGRALQTLTLEHYPGDVYKRQALLRAAAAR